MIRKIRRAWLNIRLDWKLKDLRRKLTRDLLGDVCDSLEQQQELTIAD